MLCNGRRMLLKKKILKLKNCFFTLFIIGELRDDG